MPAKQKILTAMAALAVVAVVVAAGFYYYGHDPASSPAPKCMFRLLTGYDCPGCGSQRALHALLHGRVAQAWAYNPFVFFAVPAAVFYLVVEARRRVAPRLHAAAVHPAVIAGILVAVVAYTVLRNVI